MEFTITHEKTDQTGSFFVLNNNERLAYLSYTEKPAGVLQLTHTFVSDALRGQKMASKVVEAAIAFARKNNKKLNPVCTYAIAWFEKHPHENDLLVEANDRD